MKSIPNENISDYIVQTNTILFRHTFSTISSNAMRYMMSYFKVWKRAVIQPGKVLKLSLLTMKINKLENGPLNTVTISFNRIRDHNFKKMLDNAKLENQELLGTNLILHQQRKDLGYSNEKFDADLKYYKEVIFLSYMIKIYRLI